MDTEDSGEDCQPDSLSRPPDRQRILAELRRELSGPEWTQGQIHELIDSQDTEQHGEEKQHTRNTLRIYHPHRDDPAGHT